MARHKIVIFFSCFLFFFFLGARVALGVCAPFCGGCNDGSSDCASCPACPREEKPLGTFKGLGVLSDFINSLNPTNPEPAASAFTNFISKAIGIMTVVAFIWFIFVLFIGAIAWLGSGGDKAKLQEAQKKITTALTGLVIVISAIFLTKIISLIFDIDILDLTNFITNLGK